MTTKRNRITENRGPRFVQKVVEDNNCIYQQIELDNDQGNDCYIEFISGSVATSYCVFAQIKTGKSFRDNRGYKIPANSDHLAYWHNHNCPVVGIVYDEQKEEAFWINISEYLLNKPEVLSQKYHTIRISHENPFSQFRSFNKYFIGYISEYKSFENYGRSLSNFANIDEPKICYDGFKSLYSNHRHRESSWFYIVINFGKIKERSIHGNILGMMSNYALKEGLLHIAGIEEYNVDSKTGKILTNYLSQYFGLHEVSIALDFMREGINAGSFTYRVYTVLLFVKNIQLYLLELTYSEPDPERRDFDFWLFVHVNQWKSIEQTIARIEEYFKAFPDADEDGVIKGLWEYLKQGVKISIG